MRVSNYCADHLKIFALSHHLASAHECALPVDMDLCRIYGHLYDALRHQICAVRRCVYQDRHHVADEPDDRGQNCVPDDLNYHGVDGHDRNCEPDVLDDPNYHGVDGHDQSCELDDLIDH
jgi:hypothetical protein